MLNTITTGAMIRLGKTFGNLMVDLRATNDKLKDRSERIVMEVAGIDRQQAHDLLGRAGGVVKTAIVMQLLGVDRAEAEKSSPTMAASYGASSSAIRHRCRPERNERPP